ncbi:MAG: bifunctional fucokinase/L-fucose-1-P-guanylyltransferase [Eubacterium sp.]|nr:bifunctional fucokinase/L-fucose-1-P-guanylyltransferase [Eubacterium sp.]
MKNLFSLFLSQSYQDCWDDYNRSIKSPSFPHWDYIILTASNEQQAEGFRKQIEERGAFLPSQTRFAVIPDRDGKRVGSGGATLSVIRYLHEQEGSFQNLRVLVIHSGGDSKRVPQYSALGKLFSPVPHELPNGRTSTLFDEFLICMSSVPSRIREGMLLLSGDVLLLFNPLQIDYNGRGAAAISFKEHVETGKNHGVFLNGEDGNVKRFLHKQTVETLRDFGAVNESDCVDIDTGAVIFSSAMLDSLYALVASDDDYDRYVNETVRLSLYGDFLYPLAADSTLEQFYKEKPEGEMCEDLLEARARVWEALCPYRLKLLRLAPAKFIHFGTTREILNLMSGGVEEYHDLGWSRQVGSSMKQGDCAGYNSVLSSRASIGENCYLEVAFVHSKAKVGSNVLLSYIDIHDETIPDDVVLHGLKQRNGKFVVRIYGINDNPKENKLFGRDLDEISAKLGMNLWENGPHTLWTADLYPEKDTIKEAVAAALDLYDLAAGSRAQADTQNDQLCEEKLNTWRDSSRKSLCSGFNAADPDAIIAWDKRMRELVQMDEITKAIRSQTPAKQMAPLPSLTRIQKEWLEKRLKTSDFSDRMRLHYYLGNVIGSEEEIQECFRTIQSVILEATIKNLKYNENARIVTDRHTVKLPLRVNWGGGWSDTPPYCNEHGGTVLNVAIRLNGENPVEVTLEKIPEHKIVFDSRDMDVHGEFDTIEPLQETGDPFDPFALQKACLLACGIIPKEGHNLDEILTRLGGGFVMHSEVTNVPKGSGLGTSSILSAACVKAVFEFMGIDCTEDDLYSHVLAMEQIMSTGGGWQDQVGGVTPGLKYITSRPGVEQKIKVSHIELSEETRAELDDRFALIYTGQRRLARNLLRDVIGRYVGNEPDSLFALNEIQKVAALMRFELERGNVDEFAKLLDYHWELSQKVDKGSTNTLIDQIFGSIDDLIDGRLVCGAGGGGFLQVVLKKGVSKADVHNRLKAVFQDSLVDVWDCELVW